MPLPDGWKDNLEQAAVDALPLVDDHDKDYRDGWCTYTYVHESAPELEVFCGGINSKTPRAGALWRQGNLMHFGFEQSPSELNENGRAMLLNSIVYIARFTEDRPILNTESPFAPGAVRFFDREVIQRVLDNQSRGIQRLNYYLSPETYAEIEGKGREEVSAWFQKARPYIAGNEKGKLMVDDEAQKFGVSPSQAPFFEAAIAALQGDDEKAATARRLLTRYAPFEFANNASADQWERWWEDNKPYLFFTDTGGYRWHVDPLAKKRGVPTQNLRGPSRATRSLDSLLDRQNE